MADEPIDSPKPPESEPNTEARRPSLVTREDLGDDPIEVAAKVPAGASDTEPRPGASGWTAPSGAAQGGAPSTATSARPEVYPPTPTSVPSASRPPLPAGPYDPQAGEYFDPRDFARLPRRSGPLRRIAIIAAVLLVVAIIGKSGFDRWYDAQITPDGPPGPVTAFRIEDGWTLNQVADALEDEKVITDGFFFRRWCNDRVNEDAPAFEGQPVALLCDFQAGRYQINTNLTFEAAATLLAKGPIPEEFLSINIPEGLTLDEIGPRLVSRNPAYDLVDINEAFDQRFVDSLLFPEDLILFGVEGYRHPLEGLLFPATYDISDESETDEIELLTKMAREMETRVDALVEAGLPQVAQDLDLTPYQMITIASMIEEEAKINEDRPKIAQVIYNRLAAGWTLGIDATTRYQFNKAPGSPLLQSEIDSELPYNTRVVAGLPPTPIAAPGQASLEAAFNPEEGPWMYYVLTNEGDVAGAHTFAVTEQEFNDAKAICIERDLGCG